VRSKTGVITSFDTPGDIGTIGLAINAAGVITGYYYDASEVVHGFVRKP
jgi:hypothetical protein